MVTGKATGDGAIVWLSGEIDFDALDTLREACDEVVALQPRIVDVDVADVSVIDFSGLNLLLALRKRCAEIGTHVRMVHASNQMLSLLHMTGLTQYFVDDDNAGPELARGSAGFDTNGAAADGHARMLRGITLSMEGELAALSLSLERARSTPAYARSALRHALIGGPVDQYVDDVLLAASELSSPTP